MLAPAIALLAAASCRNEQADAVPAAEPAQVADTMLAAPKPAVPTDCNADLAAALGPPDPFPAGRQLEATVGSDFRCGRVVLVVDGESIRGSFRAFLGEEALEFALDGKLHGSEIRVEGTRGEDVVAITSRTDDALLQARLGERTHRVPIALHGPNKQAAEPVAFPLPPDFLAALDTVPPDASIEMTRGGGMGQRPRYTVTIDAKGNVAYQGKRGVAVIGERQRTISPDIVLELLRRAGALGFFRVDERALSATCWDLATDAPTAYVTITANEQTHSVKDYQGCFDDINLRPELDALEDAIDEAALEPGWIRATEE